MIAGSEQEGFDVFLCHNSRESVFARRLAAALSAQQVRPWLDVDQLLGGDVWPLHIERVLSCVRAVAVLWGPSGAGTWAEQERAVALHGAASRGIPVIPVLLPGGCPESLPGWLSIRHVVDMRDGLSAERLAHLRRAILRPESGIPPPLDPPDAVALVEARVVDEISRWLQRKPVGALVREALAIEAETVQDVARAVVAMLRADPIKVAIEFVIADRKLRHGCMDKALVDEHPLMRIFELGYPHTMPPSLKVDGDRLVRMQSGGAMAAEAHRAQVDERAAEWIEHEVHLLIGRRAVPPPPESGMSAAHALAATCRFLAAQEGMQDSGHLTIDVQARLQIIQEFNVRGSEGYYPYYGLLSEAAQAQAFVDELPELPLILLAARDKQASMLMQLVRDLQERKQSGLGGHSQ